MWCAFVCLGLFTLLLLCILCRRAVLNALETVETREADTYKNIHFAVRVLWGDEDKVKFVATKDRSNQLLKGASRRKSSSVVAKMLMERKKREDKIQSIRTDLAKKLQFKKAK